MPMSNKQYKSWAMLINRLRMQQSAVSSLSECCCTFAALHWILVFWVPELSGFFVRPNRLISCRYSRHLARPVQILQHYSVESVCSSAVSRLNCSIFNPDLWMEIFLCTIEASHCKSSWLAKSPQRPQLLS